jgi:quercetin dioxygenase-like cupin family protein
MAKAHIFRFDEIAPVDRGEGISTKPFVSKAVGSTNLTNGVTTFPPGGALRLHTHNCDESVTLIEGQGLVEIDGEQFPMKPFDTTFVPAGTPHRFINKGAQPMRILWNYTSVNVTRTFTDTGETVGQLAPGDKGGIRA